MMKIVKIYRPLECVEIVELALERRWVLPCRRWARSVRVLVEPTLSEVVKKEAAWRLL